MRFIGALLITYFVSRLFRRLGLKPPPTAKLLGAHLASLVLISLFVVMMRYPTNAFYAPQLWVYVFAQLWWLIVDAVRHQVALWKPPVTESSPTARGASSR